MTTIPTGAQLEEAAQDGRAGGAAPKPAVDLESTIAQIETMRAAPLRELLLNIPKGYAVAKLTASGMSDYFVSDPLIRPSDTFSLHFQSKIEREGHILKDCDKSLN